MNNSQENEMLWQFNLPSTAEMAEYDAHTIAAGTESPILMERAGSVIASRIAQLRKTKRLKVTVLCGPGNNGGDGLVISRLLRKKGFAVACVISEATRYSQDFLLQMQKLKTKAFVYPINAGLKNSASLSASELIELISQSDVIVDALLGSGQQNAPRGVIAHMLECLAQSKLKKNCIKISVDIPTGINADSGEVYQPHFAADLTITIELIKRGLLQYPARISCGKIEIKSIGLDCSKPSQYGLICKHNLILPPLRKGVEHKGNFGRILVIGGSENMPGAAALCAYAALRAGAGVVTHTVFKNSSVPAFFPELILETVEGPWSAKSAILLLEKIRGYNCLVVGPGLGANPGSIEFVQRLLATIVETRIATIIDADALNILALAPARRLANCILTPHPGEMARLLGISNAEVQRDRYQAAETLSQRFSCVTVLKGAATVVCAPANQGGVNSSGNAYMASAGSGDVLSGIIASLVGQGLGLVDAAKTGVFLHGLAGDLAYEKSQAPIIASDIIKYVPKAISNIRTFRAGHPELC